MKKEKRKRVLYHLILLFILAVPLFFILRGRHEYVLYEQIIIPLLTVLGCYVCSIFGGLLLTLALYKCGNVYSAYEYIINRDTEHSIEFEKGWEIKEVMDKVYFPSMVLVFIALYIVCLIGL